MSLHIWRKIYWVFGWEYPEQADEKQKWRKHKLNEEIRSNNVKLKSVSQKESVPQKEYIPLGWAVNGYSEYSTVTPWVQELVPYDNNKSKSKTIKKKRKSKK